MEGESNIGKQILPVHHVQQELCSTRPLYRRGKKLTAVKIYTVNNESQHLLVYGVPELNLSKELRSLFLKYGEIKIFEKATNYEIEQFTECYHCNYKRIQSSRIAKRFLDNKSFYGGILHICYASEYETLSETREKFKQRIKDVKSRAELNGPTQLEYANIQEEDRIPTDRKRKHPAIPITLKRLKTEKEIIWEGIPKELDPRLRNPYGTKDSFILKKHFQLKTKDPMYGPFKVDVGSSGQNVRNSVLSTENNTTNAVNNTETNRTDIVDNIETDIVKTTLIPTAVIKNYKKDYYKQIIFRKNKNVLEKESS